ncbi:MAG: acetate kinase [Oscillospiraceae bacterium]|nr:acetate kinase [Oscillospiraceae bacterium]
MNVLVVNAGSSSLKYQLFDTNTNIVKAKGLCEYIGSGGTAGTEGNIKHKVNGKINLERAIPMPNHAVATGIVVEMLTHHEFGCIKNMDEIEAVGHRIVHGGSYFSDSVLVNDDVVAKLEKCIDFAPLHTPPHLMGIRGCMEVMPDTPQVLVFDTGFHKSIPEEAYIYPIPYKYYEKYQIRRYGFHGTSHKYVSQEMCKILGRTEGTKIVTCHMGNGSSVAAVKDGKGIDTSMGFTPLEGVSMGTRSGSIDPAIVTFIMKKENFTPQRMDEFMNKECGLLGVSEVSNDSRDLEKAIKEGNPKALLAMNILAYQIKKYIGAYSAAMNGLDAVVFTAGIGENNYLIRERICRDMDYLGIKIDEKINEKTLLLPNAVEISTGDSKVKVYVIPTNEELVIAYDTADIVNNLIKM